MNSTRPKQILDLGVYSEEAYMLLRMAISWYSQSHNGVNTIMKYTNLFFRKNDQGCALELSSCLDWEPGSKQRQVLTEGSSKMADVLKLFLKKLLEYRVKAGLSSSIYETTKHRVEDDFPVYDKPDRSKPQPGCATWFWVRYCDFFNYLPTYSESEEFGKRMNELGVKMKHAWCLYEILKKRDRSALAKRYGADVVKKIVGVQRDILSSAALDALDAEKQRIEKECDKRMADMNADYDAKMEELKKMRTAAYNEIMTWKQEETAKIDKKKNALLG